MATHGQQDTCGNIMALFDAHSKCARCHEKGLGTDDCVQVSDLEFTSPDHEELLDVGQEVSEEQTYRETIRG